MKCHKSGVGSFVCCKQRVDLQTAAAWRPLVSCSQGLCGDSRDSLVLIVVTDRCSRFFCHKINRNRQVGLSCKIIEKYIIPCLGKASFIVSFRQQFQR